MELENKLEVLKNRFNKQMEKQRYDCSGRKEEFIAIVEELFQVVADQQSQYHNLLEEYNQLDEQAERWKEESGN